MMKSEERQSGVRFRDSAVTGEAEMRSEEWQALCRRVRTLPARGRIVEVGTAAGGTLVRLLQALPAQEHSRVSVVDTFRYFPGHLDIWKKNLRDNGLDFGDLDILVDDSMGALRTVTKRGQRLSLVLIDAGHKLKDVIRDVRWLGLLDIGGVAAFHDYSPAFPGVMLAVDLFLRRHPEFRRESLEGTLLFIRKEAEPERSMMPAGIVALMSVRSLLMQWEHSLRKRMGTWC